jgi:predicted nucleotidyltransferase
VDCSAVRPILNRVTSHLNLKDTLAQSALSEVERRTISRLVKAFRAELGEQLRAVWLYGSRARNEADPTETDPDRRSDVDLLVIVDPERRADEFSWEAIRLVEAAATAEGDSPVWYSVLVWDSERLRDRREIRSFFVEEVDRDKIVLAGSALDGSAGAGAS